MNDLILYTTEDGRSQIKLRAKDQTVWLSQREMAELFDATKQNISLHLKNLFEDGELDAAATCREFRQVRTEAFAELEYVNFNKAQIAKASQLESDFDRAMKLLPKPKQAKQKKKHD